MTTPLGVANGNSKNQAFGKPEFPYTPPTPRELRIRELREAIARDEKSTFKVRPETLAEWKRELEELEKQDKPQ